MQPLQTNAAAETPSAPPVHTSPSARPVYSNKFERADINPIVRPESHAAKRLDEGRAHRTPAAPPVVEAAPSTVAPVVEAAPSTVAPVVEAAQSTVAPVVEAAPSAVAPVVEAAPNTVAPVVEAAPSTVAPPVVEAAPSTVAPPVVEAAIGASSSGSALAETPTIDANASAVVEAPSAAAPIQASAFETAPTEFAGSETPIAQSTEAEPAHAATLSVDEARAHEVPAAAEGPVAEPVAAELAPVETPAAASPESAVGGAALQVETGRETLPYPGPPRSFTSSGSEMPVVITTPASYRRSSAPASNLFSLGRELLPRAQAWSKKTLRTNPRALVIAAPLLALLGIWAVRSTFSHPTRALVAETNSNVAAQPTQTSAAAIAPAASGASPTAILATTSTPATAAPPGADAAELTSAITHGLPALEALAQKYPHDPQVGIALASQQAQAQRFEAAVGSLERVIQADPNSAQNGKIMGILWRAAQSDASEPTFLALRRMGARGADIAYDLATTAGVRDSVRERAKSELETSLSPDASADTRVASALLLASDCKARKSLLARAEREGGKRTRAQLEQYSRGSSCASNTDKACNTCLTGSPALTHALSQLSAGGKK